MKTSKLIAVATLFFGLAAAHLFAYAQPQLGREYTLVEPPQPTTTGNKIEVLELFWYGCPHCYKLEPIIEPWIKKLPTDVAFRRMPAIFRAGWVPGAKAFYAMKALGVLGRLHDKLFAAIHLQGLDIADDSALFDWIAKQGVERKVFVAAYNSFGVQSKTRRAEHMTRVYGISGVPSVIVDGRYRTSSSMAGGHKELPAVLDYLIGLARKDHAAKVR
jgi:thiol:disulfide interchange protein DsbA